MRRVNSRNRERDAIRAVAALDEGVRRRLFDFVRSAGHPISRDEAAAAAGISRNLAAFHLDRLVDAGLLRFRFRREGAPRVGRRPKVYEPVAEAIRVSIPERRHELLAEILVEAVLGESSEVSATTAAASAARQRGHDAGAARRNILPAGTPETEQGLVTAEKIITDYGFEPARISPHCIRLRNCPFHPIAQRAPELVCELNYAFMQGILDGLRLKAVAAVRSPAAGECCVELRGETGASPD
ncbi:transcriptional regulator [Mycobacterium sp. SM1]|uniref:helix-turn-helix transcriptional regulator n=1 Tax=Mycobacterium sp. SM1 TaxID=2816243 RepID=UPI001BCF59C9|nr:helix-turn-helix domain-containing protein [Mycobacterium sp. SM1]MBS4727963.1 transcriptional regulator [Mycobacterium sp. SM1]